MLLHILGCFLCAFIGGVAGYMIGSNQPEQGNWKKVALNWKKAHASAWSAYENARQLLSMIRPDIVKDWPVGTKIKDTDHITLP